MMGTWRGLREKLRGARSLEWLILLAAACVAALMFTQGGGVETAAQSTELEARLERVLSAIDGAGEVRAMITEREGSIVGVVVVAEGAAQMRVRLSLMQAARALLGVELERIEVIEMRGDAYAQTDGGGIVYSGGASFGRAGLACAA
ncbi:MAG TPA: hypothetical protein IAA75_01780 [Candidatus Pullichristensenella avicola]|nr:hypothetical protein [Candidatus Pullichristensenella avicola]